MYCIQPPGGDWDTSASLVRSCHIHPLMEKNTPAHGHRLTHAMNIFKFSIQSSSTWVNLIDWLCLCSTAPSAGHPDSVRLHRWVLGPRPWGPPDGAVRRRALLRHGVPGQAVGSLRLGGEAPWRNLGRGREIELDRNTGWGIEAEQLGEISGDCHVCAGLFRNRRRRSKVKTHVGLRDSKDGLPYTDQDQREPKINQTLFALYQYLCIPKDVYSMSFLFCQYISGIGK